MSTNINSEIWMSERLDNWLKAKYGKTLSQVCKALGYSEENLDIMSVKKDKKSMMDLYKRNKTLFDSFNADKTLKKRLLGEGKTWTEHFHNVIAGWVIEDLFARLFKKNGFDVLSEDANNRKIKTAVVKTTSLISVSKGRDFSRKMEIRYQNSEYPFREGYIVFPYNDFMKAYKEHRVILCLDFTESKYILIDLAAEDVVVHTRYNERAGMNVVRYFLEDNGKQTRAIDYLPNETEAVCMFNPANASTKLVEEDDADSPMHRETLVEQKELPTVFLEEPETAAVAKESEVVQTPKQPAKKSTEAKEQPNQAAKAVNTSPASPTPKAIAKPAPKVETNKSSSKGVPPPKKVVAPSAPPPKVEPVMEVADDDFDLDDSTAVSYEDFDCDFV